MFILTATLDPVTHDRLTRLRTQYFPKEKNFLDAHVTLFHALSENQRSIWEADIGEVVQKYTDAELKFGELYSLGQGVAIKIESKTLINFRNELSERWSHFLSAQDQQKFKPHCTVQNKVSAAIARDTLRELRNNWQPFESKAVGTSLWNYLGGPWKLDTQYYFKK